MEVKLEQIKWPMPCQKAEGRWEEEEEEEEEDM